MASEIILYEYPLNKEEAIKHGIKYNYSLARLVYACDNSDALASAVIKCKPMYGSIFIASMNLSCDQHQLHKIKDLEIIAPYNNLVKVDNIQAIRDALLQWEAESLVVFFTDCDVAKYIVADVNEQERKRVASKEKKSGWWKFSKKDYYANFLCHVEYTGLFMFYSAGYNNVEMLGDPPEIEKCLTIFCQETQG